MAMPKIDAVKRIRHNRRGSRDIIAEKYSTQQFWIERERRGAEKKKRHLVGAF